MEKEKRWLKFIISGKAEDYLSYVNSKKDTDEAVSGYSLFNRGAGDSAEQHRRQ